MGRTAEKRAALSFFIHRACRGFAAPQVVSGTGYFQLNHGIERLAGLVHAALFNGVQKAPVSGNQIRQIIRRQAFPSFPQKPQAFRKQ